MSLWSRYWEDSYNELLWIICELKELRKKISISVGGPRVKEPTCQCRRHRLDPWIRKMPWSRAWQPTPVFLPGESQGWRNLAGYSPWGVRVGRDWATTIHTRRMQREPPIGRPLQVPILLQSVHSPPEATYEIFPTSNSAHLPSPCRTLWMYSCWSLPLSLCSAISPSWNVLYSCLLMLTQKTHTEKI